MSESEVIVNPAPTAPAQPVEAAPIVVAQPASPVVEAAPVSVDVAPVVTAPTAEAAPVEAPVVVEAVKEPVSLLNSVEAVKPAVEADKAPAEAQVTQQSAESAPLPTFEPWQLPENVSAEDEKIQSFTSKLAEFEKLSKADHAEVQKLGQEFLNTHLAEQQKAIESVVKSITDGWEKQKNDWRKEVESDSVIGGDKLAATLTSANQLLNTHAPKTGADFRNLMETSGYGNHPVVLRFLSEVSGSMSEGRPLPAVKPPAAPVSKMQKLYGG